MAYTYRHGDRPLEGVTIQRAVGRGGFGEVYYAVSDSGKQLALKYLRENPEVELRGISHVMNLKSPHLVTVYDVKRDPNNEPWVIMEYITGPSLRDIMTAEERMGAQKAAFFLCGIADGLSYLHERGIVHRDLKPGNIFYDDGYVKIGDYGLSKHISVSQHSGNTVSVGTVHYMAPEIGSGSYTRAIDIYALGVILYEMLTGQLPFTGSSMGEILMRHLSERPDVSGLPEPFASVIAKALAKDPNDRFQDVNEMVDIIKASETVNESMRTFDPKSFHDVPRTEEADGRTLTTPPRVPPPPPLDVRRADEDPVPLPPKMQKKMDRLEQKLAKKRAKLSGKMGIPRPAKPRKPRAASAKRGRGFRWGHLFVILAVLVAVSIAMGAATGNRQMPEHVFTYLFFLVGGTVGTLVTYFVFLRPLPGEERSIFDRLAYASVAALCMLLGLAPASGAHGNDLPAVYFAPLAALLLCNWTRRIESGRRGEISGWDAFMPAVIGMFAAAIADADELVFAAAALTATMTLLIQAAAGLWPLPAVLESYPYVPPGGGDPLRDDDAPASPSPSDGPDLDETLPAGKALAPEAVPAIPPAPDGPSPPRAQTRHEEMYEAPSFVGRTANAGLSFLGKLLLLFGLAWAALYTTRMDMVNLDNRVRVGATRVEVHDHGHKKLSVEVPRIAIMAPLALGGLFLLLSRRNATVGHFLRGCASTALILGATLILLLSETTPKLAALFGDGERPRLKDDDVATIVFMGIMLFVAAVLLLWPNPRRRRRTIVV